MNPIVLLVAGVGLLVFVETARKRRNPRRRR